MHKLAVKELSFSYGSQTVFEKLSLSFDKQGLYLLSAPSGRGKTTLLRLISGLIKPQSGEIIGGGIGNVAFAFQESRLFPMLSALQNAAISATEADAADLLLHLGFSRDDLSKMPAELSGGMRQRVSLVRALLFDAPILLLDEPFKGLDDSLREKVYNIIREKAKTQIVILVSHDLDDAKNLSATLINL